jgi:hypothetical protein
MMDYGVGGGEPSTSMDAMAGMVYYNDALVKARESERRATRKRESKNKAEDAKHEGERNWMAKAMGRSPKELADAMRLRRLYAIRRRMKCEHHRHETEEVEVEDARRTKGVRIDTCTKKTKNTKQKTKGVDKGKRAEGTAGPKAVVVRKGRRMMHYSRETGLVVGECKAEAKHLSAEARRRRRVVERSKEKVDGEG